MPLGSVPVADTVTVDLIKPVFRSDEGRLCATLAFFSPCFSISLLIRSRTSIATLSASNEPARPTHERYA